MGVPIVYIKNRDYVNLLFYIWMLNFETLPRFLSFYMKFSNKYCLALFFSYGKTMECFFLVNMTAGGRIIKYGCQSFPSKQMTTMATVYCISCWQVCFTQPMFPIIFLCPLVKNDQTTKNFYVFEKRFK